MSLTAALVGNGILTLQPTDPARNITLAGTAANALNLGASDLGEIQPGFQQVIFGRPDGFGTITVASAVSLPASVTLQAPATNGSTVGTVVGADLITVPPGDTVTVVTPT